MSTVVVVRKGNRVAIAADTMSTSGSTKINSKYKRDHSKVLLYGDSYIGVVGDAVQHNILTSIFNRERKSRLSFVSTVAIFETFRALHPVLKEDYFINTAEEENDPYESSQITALIANPYGIFEVDSWREVFEYERFWAVGSGRDFALGAMFAAYERDATAEQIAELGVAAGCEFDDGSGAPFTLHTIELAKPKATKKRKK